MASDCNEIKNVQTSALPAGASNGQVANLNIEMVGSLIANSEKLISEGNGQLEDAQVKKLMSCIVSMNADYPKNQYLFSLDDKPFITIGDLHTIGAKQKGGKTSLVTILLSAILCGQWNRIKCLVEDASVLYIDTEMKMVDTQQLGVKAAGMGGVSVETLSEKIHLVNFRPLTPKEMEDGIRYFVHLYKPTLVIIDGIVDLCANFNDVEASQNLVLNFFMKIAEEHQCAIIGVLHTNKTDGYTELRGHLGAFLEQKGVTVIKCEKDDNSNIVTVKFPTHRYAPLPEFHFGFDEDGVPVPADAQFEEIEAAKQRSKEEVKAAEKADVYRKRSQVIIDILNDNNGSMERKPLKEEAMKRLNLGASTVNSLISTMKSETNAAIAEEKGVVTVLVF